MNIIGREVDIKKENIESRSRSMFSGGEKTLSLLLSATGLCELYTYWQQFSCSNNIKNISVSRPIFIGKTFKNFHRRKMRRNEKNLTANIRCSYGTLQDGRMKRKIEKGKSMYFKPPVAKGVADFFGEADADPLRRGFEFQLLHILGSGLLSPAEQSGK
jgi:hypothetical protein